MSAAAVPQTLPALLEARRACARPALYDRDRPVSFAELAAEAQRLAAGFSALGIREGDRVALWLPNVSAWLASFFACAQLGAIALALNTRFRSHEVADIVGRAGCKAIVLWPGYPKLGFAETLEAAGAPDSLQLVIGYAEGEPLPATLAGRSVTPYASLGSHANEAVDVARADAGCAIFTTSGTTKAPKFALHSQRSLITHAFDVARGFGLDAQSVLLLAPPLCGVFGLCSAMGAMAAEVPIVMAPAWDAAEAARRMDEHRVTHVNCTDEVIAQLLAQNDRVPAFPSLRFAAFGAFNPALADIVQRAQSRGMTVAGLYGTSEIQALFALQDPAAPVPVRAPGGGHPVSELARVRARDPESGRVLSHGEAGELEFHAPGSRMTEYFGDPEATGKALDAEGWYRSGDLGYTRADGSFVFVTRMGDSLRLGGFLVSPLEIEEVVQEVPAVRACQVVAVTVQGAPRPVAFVTLAPGATLDEKAVIEHVAARVARYKVPIRVFAIEAFPTTEGANATKVQKHKLRQLAENRLH